MQKLFLLLAPSLLTLIEGVLLVAAVALILFSSKKSRDQPAAFLGIERWFARLAHRRRLAVLVIGFSVIAIRVALIPILGIPQPSIHDEFSYLLAADTFAHGRLTNPAHPMWIHFETFHELSRPTYASKYPPSQGVVLAIGQIFHAPWAAVWLCTAVLCGLVTWAVWSWLEPSWAIVAGLLTALQLT